MKDENKKKTKTSALYLVLMLLIGIPLLIIVLVFIAVLSPFLTIGYVSYQWFNYLNDRNRRRINLKLMLNNNNFNHG
ncbi:hypothetical protein [Wocania ichthyoenteri]|uniref:hypothetical protein n=1 Tax=Wocania ichthyoenteri TaxID=1230531 RepID=UPI00053D2CCA|nr:hypothetical protein [Wocania ichthyoenteri]